MKEISKTTFPPYLSPQATVYNVPTKYSPTQKLASGYFKEKGNKNTDNQYLQPSNNFENFQNKVV